MFQHYCFYHFQKHSLSAPTGAAGTHIKYAQTIHSMLKIPISLSGDHAKGKQLRDLQSAFVGCHTVFIDEISMVGDKLLTVIHQQLCQISGKTEPFGGFNIVVIGDFCQIRPIKAKYAFHNHLLWHLFTPKFLMENHRQSSDTAYTKLLNRARVGMLTEEDHVTLKKRLLCEEFDTENYPNVIRIFGKKAQVDKFNKLCQKKISSRIHSHHFKTRLSPWSICV